MTDLAPGAAVQAPLWVLGAPDALPSGWAERATPMLLVRVSQQDFDALRPGAQAGGRTQFLRLVAQGTPREQIATALGVSTRTVDRWMAALRTELGVATSAALATRLTSAGWS
jgi:hypothetical protein